MRLDVIDEPIGGGVMSSGWFITSQFRLDYLGQLLPKFNSVVAVKTLMLPDSTPNFATIILLNQFHTIMQSLVKNVKLQCESHYNKLQGPPKSVLYKRNL